MLSIPDGFLGWGVFERAGASLIQFFMVFFSPLLLHNTWVHEPHLQVEIHIMPMVTQVHISYLMQLRK